MRFYEFVRGGYGAIAAMCVAVGVGLTPTASAQDVTRPSGRHVQQGDWTFVAVVKKEGQSFEIPGVLALREKAHATGDNIVAIWYTPPASRDGEWEAKAWESQDQSKAVAYVKEQFQIADTWNALWPTGDQLINAFSSDPLDYDRGLLVSDLYSFLVDSASRDPAVQFLTDIGYKSANVPIEKAGEVSCKKNEFLWAYSDAVVFGAIHEQAADAEWLAQGFSQVLLSCAAPPPAPPPPTILPGTTIPVPGTPISPDWWFDPGTTNHDLSCNSSYYCCYKSTIKFLYSAPCLIFGTCIYYCQSDFSWGCQNPSGGPCPAIPACADPDASAPLVPPAGYTADCGRRYY